MIRSSAPCRTLRGRQGRERQRRTESEPPQSMLDTQREAGEAERQRRRESEPQQRSMAENQREAGCKERQRWTAGEADQCRML